MPAAERPGAGERARDAEGHDRASREAGAVPGRGQPGRRDRHEGERDLREQAGLHGCHLPVTCRSAATIASGSGGQPGTSRSTSTWSCTAPATP